MSRQYGNGKAAFCICAFCGRGGARTMGPRGKAHLKCVPADERAKYSTPVSSGGPWCPECGGTGNADGYNVQCGKCRGTGIADATGNPTP